MGRRSRRSSRAGAISWLPIAWLYSLGPRQTVFNVVLYQLHYRHKWNGAAEQDISALTSWIDSAQGMALAVLIAAALWFLIYKCEWERKQRDEFYLSLWLAAGIAAELATAHPTFERYFLLMIPFAVIPAIVGFYVIGVRLAREEPLDAAYVLIVIVFLGLAKSLYDDRDSYAWRDTEQIAQKVEQVTPKGGTIWADELIYFLMRRPPPDGMEFSYAHEIEEMPKAQSDLLHILTASELRRRTAAETIGRWPPATIPITPTRPKCPSFTAIRTRSKTARSIGVSEARSRGIFALRCPGGNSLFDRGASKLESADRG